MTETSIGTIVRPLPKNWLLSDHGTWHCFEGQLTRCTSWWLVWCLHSRGDQCSQKSAKIGILCGSITRLYGGFRGFHGHEGTPKMLDGLFHGNSHEIGWFRGTPIHGNPYIYIYNRHQQTTRGLFCINILADDRACTGARVWDLMERFHAWCGCGCFYSGSSYYFAASLARVCGPGCWALGFSCTMVAKPGLTSKEQSLVEACDKISTLLSCIGVPFEGYTKAAWQFAESKVA